MGGGGRGAPGRLSLPHPATHFVLRSPQESCRHPFPMSHLDPCRSDCFTASVVPRRAGDCSGYAW